MLRWLEEGALRAYQDPTLDPTLDPRSARYRESSSKQSRPVMMAGEAMNTELVTIGASSTQAQAWEAMNLHAVHHLPVVQDNRLLGLVSDRDLFGFDDRQESLVSDVMTRCVLTARVDSSLWSVARIMIDESINCVLVIDAEQMLEGILTSLDILACMTHQAPLDVWG